MSYPIKYLIIMLVMAGGALQALAQGSAGAKAEFESRFVVDMPTAGVLRKGTYSGVCLLEKSGTVMMGFNTAVWTNINIGIYYSGVNIIGSAEPVWQGLPGFSARWRVLDETLKYPALTIGCETEGRGMYIKNSKRFETYSPGVFLASSKNYVWWLGPVAFHAGLGYSFEHDSRNRVPNVWLGAEQSLLSRVSLNGEYNLRLDDKSNPLYNSNGLLNAGLRWSIHNGFTLELQLRDLLKSNKGSTEFSRAICLEYIAWY